MTNFTREKRQACGGKCTRLSLRGAQETHKCSSTTHLGFHWVLVHKTSHLASMRSGGHTLFISSTIPLRVFPKTLNHTCDFCVDPTVSESTLNVQWRTVLPRMSAVPRMRSSRSGNSETGAPCSPDAVSDWCRQALSNSLLLSCNIGSRLFFPEAPICYQSFRANALALVIPKD